MTSKELKPPGQISGHANGPTRVELGTSNLQTDVIAHRDPPLALCTTAFVPSHQIRGDNQSVPGQQARERRRQNRAISANPCLERPRSIRAV